VSCGQTDQRKVFALRKFIIKTEMRNTVREVKQEKYPWWLKEFTKERKE
jgi:hypothetical protein